MVGARRLRLDMEAYLRDQLGGGAAVVLVTKTRRSAGNNIVLTDEMISRCSSADPRGAMPSSEIRHLQQFTRYCCQVSVLSVRFPA